MDALFWASVLGCVYSYLIYPIILLVLLPFRSPVGQAEHSSKELPRLAFIVAAHNEAQRIELKLSNLLALDYPKDLLRHIVVSDGSTDDTNRIVARYADEGIELIEIPERVGKERAQLTAIELTNEEILVFTDTATSLEPSCPRQIAARFGDPRIGAISSVDRLVTETGQIAGEGLYVKYEMWLRRLESMHAGLVGLSGSFFAARRLVCESLDTRAPSDFSIAIRCRLLGLKAISDPALIGMYRDTGDASREYRRKVRTILRGMNGLGVSLGALDPRRTGFFSFQLFSHKLMRWAAPWFMVAALATNIVVLDSAAIYRVTLAAQVIALAVGAIGLSPTGAKFGVARVLGYLLLVQVATMTATIYSLAGRQVAMWQPTSR